ncbi:MAG: hypothetical protein IJK51_07260 [Bacteroidaceae bacterium]|nr:hypothetical protein [Bacteroidaceae bacterium]
MNTKVLLFLCLLPFLAHAEESALEKLAQRQAAFGRTIPQEKVFVHMDNTSYQLGDTIWFTAYLRRTDTDRPSDVSGVLYVELYGQEGYMIERKLIQMKEGRGSGFFALNRYIQYAGFYELRAYTRWQLNWGRFERKHTEKIKEWFPTKRQEKEYFRDYEKLYSRVFPVYDKPLEPGEYTHDMTLRAMRRLYPNPADNRKLTLSLYPEGGNLVEGIPCRVAFEACFDDGEWAEGWVVYDGDSIKTKNRGRGCFEITPQKGQEKEVIFVSKDGKQAKAKLPKPEQTGVSLKVEQTDSGWVAHIRHTADLQDDSLGVSLMREGKSVSPLPAPPCGECPQPAIWPLISTPQMGERGGGWASGVYQLTVFDTQGRIFADRLFFNISKEDLMPTLSIEGLKEEYQPYEPVNLTLKAPQGKNQVSLTVRDDNNRDCLYDDSNILTEMLLSSEIRGFVPQPGWYFEADDEEHRSALDLLMMTQGWRRFDWRSMAVAGAWDITQPAERAPILIGNTYKNVIVDFVEGEEADNENEDDEEYPFSEDGRDPHEEDYYETKPMDLPDLFSKGKSKAREEKAYDKAINTRDQKKGTELKVHAEIVALDAESSFIGESETYRKGFRIQLPPYYGSAIVFLSAADTTKWKKGKPYTWIQAEPDNLETDYMYLPASRKLRQKIFVEPADYLARISWPYPRFVNPYSYYQNHLAPTPEKRGANGEWIRLDDETIMSEVTVKAKRRGLKKFDDTWPIFAIDAEEANNIAQDIGLGFMQVYTADFGVGVIDRKYGEGQEPTFETRKGMGRTRRMLMAMRVDSIPSDSMYARKYLSSFSLNQEGSMELSPGEKLEYEGNGVWDMYVLYSDYSPRQYGNEMYYGSNEPKTKLVQYPFPDGSRRLTYRDRRYVIPGFAYPAEFYSPDYSKQVPSEDKKDYRRTLYWNPNLKLNNEGEAEITFFNNSRITRLSVDAEGQASDGTLLWNGQHADKKRNLLPQE